MRKTTNLATMATVGVVAALSTSAVEGFAHLPLQSLANSPTQLKNSMHKRTPSADEGLSSRIGNGKDSTTRMQQSNLADIPTTSSSSSRAGLGSMIAGWASSLTSPPKKSNDFDKYMDFLGSRYSRLHEDPDIVFDDRFPVKEQAEAHRNRKSRSVEKALDMFGLEDVAKKHRANQGIVPFSFKDASTILEKEDIDVPVAKIVSNQIKRKDVGASVPRSLAMPTVASRTLKQLQTQYAAIIALQKQMSNYLLSMMTSIVKSLFKPTQQFGTLLTAAAGFAFLIRKPIQMTLLAVTAMATEA